MNKTKWKHIQSIIRLFSVSLFHICSVLGTYIKVGGVMKRYLDLQINTQCVRRGSHWLLSNKIHLRWPSSSMHKVRKEIVSARVHVWRVSPLTFLKKASLQYANFYKKNAIENRRCPQIGIIHDESFHWWLIETEDALTREASLSLLPMTRHNENTAQ